MAAICTDTVSPHACGHRTLTIVLDGETFVLDDYDAPDPLTTEEKTQLIRLGIRRLRATGVSLADFLYRCTHGDEATNVKTYDFFGPGAAITKTNIGSTYVNIPPGLNGERILIDLTGCTEFRVFMTANLLATGPFGLRLVRDGDSEVLMENAAIAQTGERELDTGWTALPVAFAGQGQTLMRVQAKSVTAADDPVFRRCSMQVR